MAGLPIAVTLGEPAGIGAEILALARRAMHEGGARKRRRSFYLRGDPAFLRARLRRAGLEVPVASVAIEAVDDAFGSALPVVRTGDAVADRPGEPLEESAPSVLASIEEAVADVHGGRASAVVTLPIMKEVLYRSGFDHPGHTEYLGALAERFWSLPAEPVMMIWSPMVAVVPVTIHIPLKEVPAALTTDRIVAAGRVVARDLRERFGVATPRLAVAGLNPHAGEGGTMGREDIEVIAPAVAALRTDGVAAFGPLPADTMFHAAARAGYDVALCMYHDQALAPAKALAFDEGVNVTLGLPFVRTSPDHGTAFAIAGTGTANPASLVESLRLAARLTP